MSSHAALWWISDAALARFGEQVDALVRTWADAWGLTAPAPGVSRTADAGEIAHAASTFDSLGPSAGAGPWLERVSGLDGIVADRLFGKGARAAVVASQVGASAAAALLDALRAFLRTPALADPDAPSTRAGAPGNAGAVHALSIEGRTVQVIVPTRWLCARGWLARPSRRPVQAWSPAKALERIPVTLTVEVGNVDVSVGDLSALAIGDVIAVGTARAEPMAVRARHTDVQLRAFLGRSDSQRAVKFVSPSSTRTSS